MRTAAFIATAFLLVLTVGDSIFHEDVPPATAPTDEVRPANALLGNESFRATFGVAPDPHTPERLRLQTHLAYVERMLRARPRPALSTAQRARRAELLDRLHEYWTQGRFPQNTEVPGRSPVFIDAEGRLCAVGHLITASAGRDLAERIDAQYHLADVQDMDLPAIDRWAKRNGFTRRELAMIQPTYDGGRLSDPPPSDNEEAPALEVTALSVSVGASLVNGVLLERDTHSIVGGAMGVASGATSLTIGLRDGAEYPTVSSLAGATSVVLGGWALVEAFRGTNEQVSLRGAADRSGRTWSVAPTALTTAEGTYPGLGATIQF
ncbi:hypothetical protein [Salinibacter grassmerensis]|uniref:hypothetical protein n=1 Tax=Salinibacter grassmerensis TaxID=3040353 RepID=UPI0021E8591C|nr:hypothetical protein [Salinibacter grassmerensis]